MVNDVYKTKVRYKSKAADGTKWKVPKRVKVKRINKSIVDFGDERKIHVTRISFHSDGCQKYGCQSCYFDFPQICPKCGGWIHCDISYRACDRYQLPPVIACENCDSIESKEKSYERLD